MADERARATRAAAAARRHGHVSGVLQRGLAGGVAGAAGSAHPGSDSRRLQPVPARRGRRLLADHRRRPLRSRARRLRHVLRRSRRASLRGSVERPHARHLRGQRKAAHDAELPCRLRTQGGPLRKRPRRTGGPAGASAGNPARRDARKRCPARRRRRQRERRRNRSSRSRDLERRVAHPLHRGSRRRRSDARSARPARALRPHRRPGGQDDRDLHSCSRRYGLAMHDAQRQLQTRTGAVLGCLGRRVGRVVHEQSRADAEVEHGPDEARRSQPRQRPLQL